MLKSLQSACRSSASLKPATSQVPSPAEAPQALPATQLGPLQNRHRPPLKAAPGGYLLPPTPRGGERRRRGFLAKGACGDVPDVWRVHPPPRSHSLPPPPAPHAPPRGRAAPRRRLGRTDRPRRPRWSHRPRGPHLPRGPRRRGADHRTDAPGRRPRGRRRTERVSPGTRDGAEMGWTWRPPPPPTHAPLTARRPRKCPPASLHL